MEDRLRSAADTLRYMCRGGGARGKEKCQQPLPRYTAFTILPPQYREKEMDKELSSGFQLPQMKMSRVLFKNVFVSTICWMDDDPLCIQCSKALALSVFPSKTDSSPYFLSLMSVYAQEMQTHFNLG